MATNVLQQLIDSGVQFTELSRRNAKSVVRDLVRSGSVRRADATRAVENLIERGRETSVMIAEVVRTEVAKQVGWLASRVDELEAQIEQLVGRVSGTGATAPSVTEKPAGGKAPAKKAPAKKSAARKSGATKTTAKKSAAKKTPAKKSAAKKSAAKKSSARKSAAKKSSAKKSAAKKSSAKKTAAKKAS